MRKRLLIKPAEKRSEQLLCNVYIRLPKLSILRMEQLEITVFVESEVGHLGTIFRIWRKKYPQVKSGRKLSVKLHCVILISLAQLILFFY